MNGSNIVNFLIIASTLFLINCKKSNPDGAPEVYRVRLDNSSSEYSSIEARMQPGNTLIGAAKKGDNFFYDIDPSKGGRINVLFFKDGKLCGEGSDSIQRGVGVKPLLQNNDVIFEYIFRSNY